MGASSPKEQKEIGRRVNGFQQSLYVYLLEEITDMIRFRWDIPSHKVMRDGLLMKFGQNEELRKALLETGGATMVEASPYDCRWGIGERCRTIYHI